MSRNKVEICGVDTSKLPVLKNEEMRKLFRQLQDEGDDSAREKLVNGNLRLVLSVIQRFNNRGEYVDDLFQVGCIGLMKSIDNFDLSHNVKFSTYAVPMIIGEIRRYLRDNNPIRVSRSLRDIAYKALQVRERLISETSKEPTAEDIAMEGTSSDGTPYDATKHPNVVDPHTFFDKDGKLWMVYGSYSGGIFILEMNPKTGFPLPGQGYGKNCSAATTAESKARMFSTIQTPNTTTYTYHMAVSMQQAATTSVWPAPRNRTALTMMQKAIQCSTSAAREAHSSTTVPSTIRRQTHGQLHF